MDIWSDDHPRYENQYVSPDGVTLLKYLRKSPIERARRDEIEEYMGEKEASEAISELKKLWMIQRTCSPVSDYDSFSLTRAGIEAVNRRLDREQEFADESTS
jgi:hypothetical protein